MFFNKINNGQKFINEELMKKITKMKDIQKKLDLLFLVEVGTIEPFYLKIKGES